MPSVKTGPQLLDLFRYDSDATIGLIASYSQQGTHETADHWIVIRDGKGRSRGLIKANDLTRLVRQIANPELGRRAETARKKAAIARRKENAKKAEK